MTTNRDDIPAWPITNPGEYETRDGEKATVEFRTECPDEEFPWTGFIQTTVEAWSDSGGFMSDRNTSRDIIGPWIDGGLPFDVVFDPAEDDNETASRFAAACEIGVGIECRYKESSTWNSVDTPRWRSDRAYRLAGSTAEWSPPEPGQPLTEARVREIVREMLSQKGASE